MIYFKYNQKDNTLVDEQKNPFSRTDTQTTTYVILILSLFTY